MLLGIASVLYCAKLTVCTHTSISAVKKTQHRRAFVGIRKTRLARRSTAASQWFYMRRIAPLSSPPLLRSPPGALYWRNVNALVMQHLAVISAARRWRSLRHYGDRPIATHPCAHSFEPYYYFTPRIRCCIPAAICYATALRRVRDRTARRCILADGCVCVCRTVHFGCMRSVGFCVHYVSTIRYDESPVQHLEGLSRLLKTLLTTSVY